MTTPEFDNFAQSYDDDLNRALAASGETKEFFARGRVQHLALCLRDFGLRPRSVLDYGCGIGNTSPLFRELLNAESVTGVDVSVRSLEVANEQLSSDGFAFATFEQYIPNASIDVVYCNGVFHHIPLDQRDAAVDYIWHCLRPGGIFGFWENNPWNPGTRHVMAQCVFDKDAKTLSPPGARRMLRENSFEILGTDYLFFFPTVLKVLRFLEPHLVHMPLGAQYQVLCRKRTSN
jgi:SAM-dependent methyltransferase